MITDINLAVLLFVIVVLFFAMDYYFMFTHDRERTDERKGWSWDYTLFTVGLGLSIILQPVILPGIGFSTSAVWGLTFQVSGIFLVLGAFGIHIWARTHLKKYYTERVEVQADHQLINSGPYALVRHPIITSFFSMSLGVLLINPALTSLAAVIYTFWDFSRAARQEEELLTKSLPDYANYMKITPRYIPRLGRMQ